MNTDSRPLERLVKRLAVKRKIITKLVGVGVQFDLQDNLISEVQTAADSAPRTGGPSQSAAIWDFMVEPLARFVADKLMDNALLPIFFIENPYPNYGAKLCAAIESNPILKKFRLINVDSTSESILSQHLLALAEVPPAGVLLFATSRCQLPRDFRSVVRTDGYTSVGSLSHLRLQEYAQRFRPSVHLSGSETTWSKWIGPQELIIASTLGDEHWESGLQQLAGQKMGAQMSGPARSLDDLYGVDAAKQWARQLFSDIALARNGQITWAEVDRGALLMGPPGTGKTTIARAIAQEAGTNFLAVTPVKDWMKGGGLDESIKLMSSTFSLARQQSPSILFIDEIDSVGNRENFSGQNASWNTAFLDALLTELDGFESRDQVIVIAATNYAENVDAALRRSGRLDRVIPVERPNAAALAAMFGGMLKKYPAALSPTDLAECAANSLGLTGADVEVMVRGARRRARLDGNRAIVKDDVLNEIYRIPTDAERRPIRSAQLKNTALHEAGHAVIGLSLGTLADQVRIASIIPNNDGALGFVVISGSEDDETQESLLDRVCMALGGRAAEELTYGSTLVSTGAGGTGRQNDLAIARRLAEAFIGSYGFGKRHPNWWSAPDGNVAVEAQDIIAEQYLRATELLKVHQHQLNRISIALLEEHVINRDRLLLLYQQTEPT